MLSLSLNKPIFVNALLAVTLSTIQRCSCSEFYSFLYYLYCGRVRAHIQGKDQVSLITTLCLLGQTKLPVCTVRGLKAAAAVN